MARRPNTARKPWELGTGRTSNTRFYIVRTELPAWRNSNGCREKHTNTLPVCIKQRLEIGYCLDFTSTDADTGTVIWFFCFYICNLQVLWHSSVSVPSHFPLACRWRMGSSRVFESHPPSPTVKPQSLACLVLPVRLLNVRFWGWQIKNPRSVVPAEGLFLWRRLLPRLDEVERAELSEETKEVNFNAHRWLYIYGVFYLGVFHNAACVTPFSWEESFAYAALSRVLNADSGAIWHSYTDPHYPIGTGTRNYWYHSRLKTKVQPELFQPRKVIKGMKLIKLKLKEEKHHPLWLTIVCPISDQLMDFESHHQPL